MIEDPNNAPYTPTPDEIEAEEKMHALCEAAKTLFSKPVHVTIIVRDPLRADGLPECVQSDEVDVHEALDAATKLYSDEPKIILATPN